MPEFAPVEIDLVVAEAEGHSWSRYIRDGGHGQPLPATSVTSPGAGARYLDYAKAIASSTSQASQQRNRSYLKYLVAPKRECCRGATSGRRHHGETTMPSQSRFGAARTRGRTPYAPDVQAGFTFWSSSTPIIGGPIVLVTAAAGLVHFIANNRETVSSTSQFHMENNRSSLKVLVGRIVQGDRIKRAERSEGQPFRKEKP